MDTQSDGIKLIDQAQAILDRDVETAYRAGDFNLTVRRAQEVVELSLKGGLKILGVDYPKIHDVAPVFSKNAKTKIEKENAAVLQRIEQISKWLGLARAPSFYLEREYVEEDARKALKDSKFVLNSVREICNLD